ncbi:MAG: metalloregulator ArsR/SmtB family transcription factor [Candidatus Paceibacterota bacterium]
MRLNVLAHHMRTAGDERRLRIICHLMKRKQLCVSDIASDFGMSVAAVSHHLQVMTKEGLVDSLRDGKRICYRLSETPFTVGLTKFIRAHGKL